MLDHEIIHHNDGIITHVGKDVGLEFFKYNAVAYRELNDNCLALTVNDEIVFVAETKMTKTTMTIIQFCFKIGHYVDNIFEII